MSRAMNLTFVSGFGIELGSVYALCIWPEVEQTALPLTFIGAAMMGYALLFRK